MKMNTIPEGKQQIYAEALYKEPIDGVPFSNAGFTVAITKNVFEGDKNAEAVLQEQVERLCKWYFEKLKKDVLETRNEMIDKIRVELDAKYKDYIKQLKDERDKLKKK